MYAEVFLDGKDYPIFELTIFKNWRSDREGPWKAKIKSFKRKEDGSFVILAQEPLVIEEEVFIKSINTELEIPRIELYR